MTTHIQILSDFNIEVFTRYLNNSGLGSEFEFKAEPYGQVLQVLTKDDGKDPEGSAAVVWTRPESVLPGLSSALELKSVDHDACLAEVDDFADAVLGFAKRRRFWIRAHAPRHTINGE